MKSQPLQTAFTSMTIGLVIFLSIWVIQASQEELTENPRVALQVKANVGKQETRADTRPDPFEHPIPQAELLSATPSSQKPAPRNAPSIEMNGIRVREVSDAPQLEQTAELNPFGIPDSVSAPATPQSNFEPPALELPEIQIADDRASISDPLDPAEIERMKKSLADEAAARMRLQAELHSLTQAQAGLKTVLEREQLERDRVQQEKQSIAVKLKNSESDLDRLKTTTKELRSEAAEMKNSLKHVTGEFDALRKRFENLQKEPRSLTSLPLPQTDSTTAPEPAPAKEQFLPPRQPDGSPVIPPAPPSDESEAIPLIEADPLFCESPVMDRTYPPMVVSESCGEACTEICCEGEPAPARGLLPQLFRKLKSRSSESCAVGSATKSVSINCCTDTEICEPERPRGGGIFDRWGARLKKSDKTHESGECGCDEQPARGLIPDIARWIEARKTHGCFNECGCGCGGY